MKKIILTIIVLIAGIIGCSKSSEKKLSGEKIDDKQTISNISENNVQTTVVSTTETTTESNLVWNKYRQSYTSKEILRQDENWSSVNH